MNNKGQTLVLFVILLPILFIIIGLIVDNGYLYLEKNSITENVENCIKNTLNKNKDTNELSIIINKNINDVVIKKINIENNVLTLNIIKDYKTIIFKQKKTINLSFKAYTENGKVIIKKE